MNSTPNYTNQNQGGKFACIPVDRITLALFVLAITVRIVISLASPLINRADLRNYYWAAQKVLEGVNPYEEWERLLRSGSDIGRADLPPLELALFSILLYLWNDPRSIQLFTVCLDALNILWLGAIFSGRFRRFVQLFYVIAPLPFFTFTVNDKGIIVGSIIVTLALLRCYSKTERLIYAVSLCVIASFVGALKWFGLFWLLPLVWYLSGGSKKRFISLLGLSLGIFLLSHTLWAPSWHVVYQFRAGRFAQPSHTSIMVLLDALGVYRPIFAQALLLFSALFVYLLFLCNRISISTTVVLSVVALTLWRPDTTPVDLAIIVFSLLLVIRWNTVTRVIFVILGSSWNSLVYLISLAPLSRASAQLEGIFGNKILQLVPYGSLRMVILSHLFLILIGVIWVYDISSTRQKR